MRRVIIHGSFIKKNAMQTILNTYLIGRKLNPFIMYLLYLIIVEFLISNFCILEFNLINITTLPQKKKNHNMIFLNFKYELNSISYNDIKYENYYLYSYLQKATKLTRLSGGCSPYNFFF